MCPHAALALDNQDKGLFRRKTQKPTNLTHPAYANTPGTRLGEKKLSASDKMPNEELPRKRARKDVSDLLSLAPDNNLRRRRNVSLCADNVGEGRRKKKTHVSDPFLFLKLAVKP